MRRRTFGPLASAAITAAIAVAAAVPVTGHAAARSVSAGAAQVVKLSDADTGRTLSVAPGTTIQVRLSQGGGRWSVPESSDALVLTTVHAGHQGKGGAGGLFRATGDGLASLSAYRSALCAPQCKAIAVRPWSVAVQVASTGTHVDATEADNGSTVTLGRGGTLTVTLHSTYWTIQGSSRPTVLAARGPATTQAEPPSSQHCVPGQGCGTVTQTFTALSPGPADITASRTTCGEALRCTPAQSRWIVHVVVTR